MRRTNDQLSRIVASLEERLVTLELQMSQLKAELAEYEVEVLAQLDAPEHSDEEE